MQSPITKLGVNRQPKLGQTLHTWQFERRNERRPMAAGARGVSDGRACHCSSLVGPRFATTSMGSFKLSVEWPLEPKWLARVVARESPLT